MSFWVKSFHASYLDIGTILRFSFVSRHTSLFDTISHNEIAHTIVWNFFVFVAAIRKIEKNVDSSLPLWNQYTAENYVMNAIWVYPPLVVIDCPVQSRCLTGQWSRLIAEHSPSQNASHVPIRRTCWISEFTKYKCICIFFHNHKNSMI